MQTRVPVCHYACAPYRFTGISDVAVYRREDLRFRLILKAIPFAEDVRQYYWRPLDTAADNLFNERHFTLAAGFFANKNSGA